MFLFLPYYESQLVRDRILNFHWEYFFFYLGGMNDEKNHGGGVGVR